MPTMMTKMMKLPLSVLGTLFFFFVFVFVFFLSFFFIVGLKGTDITIVISTDFNNYKTKKTNQSHKNKREK